MSSRSSRSSSSQSNLSETDDKSEHELSLDELELYDDGGFMPYDPEIEPLATEEQAAAYEQARVEEEEEELELNSRFNSEKEVSSWCKCGNCSLEFVVKPEECWCCADIDACLDAMDPKSSGKEIKCLIDHPAFNNCCLDSWVLRLAAIGLKTKSHKKYTILFEEGTRTEAQFLRAVSYRQIIRLIYNFTGRSIRYPLPCCAYCRVRSTFPSEKYIGFQEEEEENGNTE